MLVVSRKIGDRVVVTADEEVAKGEQIILSIIAPINRGEYRVGIEAPRSFRINRDRDINADREQEGNPPLLQGSD